MPEDPPRNSFEDERPPLDDIMAARQQNGNGPVPSSAFPAARRGPGNHESPPPDLHGHPELQGHTAKSTAERVANARRYSSTLQEASAALADAQTNADRLAELQDKLHGQEAQGKMRRLSVLEGSAREQAEKEKKHQR